MNPRTLREMGKEVERDDLLDFFFLKKDHTLGSWALALATCLSVVLLLSLFHVVIILRDETRREEGARDALREINPLSTFLSFFAGRCLREREREIYNLK